MGLFKGNLTVTRFKILCTLPANWEGTLKQAAFIPYPDAHDKTPQVGWVTIQDISSTTLDSLHVCFGPYVCLSLRMDTKKVDRQLLALRVAEAQKENMLKLGVERLGKNHRREIAESVEEALLAQSLPSIKIADFVWDTESGDAFVFSSSEAVVDQMTPYVRAAFGVEMRPVRPIDSITKGEGAFTFEEVYRLVQEPAPAPAVFEQDGWREDNPLWRGSEALASEFLVWMWRTCENGDGTVWIDDKMVWSDPATDGMLVSLQGGTPSDSPEVKLSLDAGRLPREARIGLREGELELECTLKVQTGGVVILNPVLPTVVTSGDEEMVYERMFLLQKLHARVDQLFTQFFGIRYSDAWSNLMDNLE